MTIKRNLLFLVGSISLAVSPLSAHNGALAVAVPVGGITIDGDLSDWPHDLERHQILLPAYGEHPRNGEDLQPSFRLGYDDGTESLYIALEVQDESIVVLSEGGSWDNQDGCDIYLVWRHDDTRPVVRQYAVWGNTRTASTSLSTAIGTDEFQVAMGRWTGGHRYEWRVDLRAAGADVVAPGAVLGLDIGVLDQDADGSYSWTAWGKGDSKYQFANRLGDVILGRSAERGRVQGQIHWDGEGLRGAQAVLHFPGPGAQRSAVVGADAQGFYSAAVPPGRYDIRALSRECHHRFDL
jgi:hypothetical protein